MPLSPNVVEKIRASFDRQSLMSTLGARLSQIEKGAVEIEAPIGPGRADPRREGVALSLETGETE